jgi:hypothetical protein
VEVITPADAFRLVLEAIDAEVYSNYADKITSYAWFWYPKSLRVPDGAHATATNALTSLRKHIRDGQITLRGVLRPENPPADIDPADCKDGQLHVFDQTLTIYVEGEGFKVARRYQRVFCVEKDVSKVAENISKNRFSSSEHELDLKKATSAMLRHVISAVYDDAASAGNKPPNIIELAAAVQPRLKEAGYEASGRQIKKIGSEQQFKLRRLPAGQRA